ncbi:hypothetical protein AAF712_011093 [Marasmius tenuissimus]|uniref:Uncharacterized protein n=1 Tax=Marasmius tenuissimus TaxID=585030 RepID=A0ABR2ZLA6_9AGAR|nr:hypothetical protein PM082_011041 [Marasmius tenuissimus]KAJ8094299.1 hypothetical protein PM082_006839 [Marasmius tenuissimus]
MARKRLYHTREQQRTANNLAAKRYRDKHPELLQQRRQAKVAEEEESRLQELRMKRTNRVSSSSSHKAMHSGNLGPLSSIQGSKTQKYAATLKTVRKLHAKFTDIVNNNRAFFVEEIYQKFITPVPFEGYLPPSFLDESQDQFHDMSNTVKNYQRHILYYEGPSPEWKELDEIRGEIDDVIRWIDNIYCEFLEGGILGLHEAYDEKRLGHLQYV